MPGKVVETDHHDYDHHGHQVLGRYHEGSRKKEEIFHILSAVTNLNPNIVPEFLYSISFQKHGNFTINLFISSCQNKVYYNQLEQFLIELDRRVFN